MKKFKKCTAFILAAAMALSAVCAYAQTSVTTASGGKSVGQTGRSISIYLSLYDTDITTTYMPVSAEKGGPCLDDEYTLLIPVESTALNLWGYESASDDNNITLNNGKRTIKISVTDNTAEIDGETIDIATVQTNNAVYVPYTYLELLFGVEVSWDSSENALYITETSDTSISWKTLSARNYGYNLNYEIPDEYDINDDTVSTDDNSEKVLTVVTGSGKVGIVINGQQVMFSDADPFIDENDRTMIPVRAVSEALGYDVEWDGTTQTVTINGNDRTVTLIIGESTLQCNGETVEMDTTAIISDDRTYIPVRFVAEALGCDVSYGMQMIVGYETNENGEYVPVFNDVTLDEDGLLTVVE